jgi:hypothetical protein
MPTVWRSGPYRFFFYSNEGTEPPHVHVQVGRNLAKFWLDPVSLAAARHFKAHEVSQLERLVVEHQKRLLEAWNAFFNA